MFEYITFDSKKVQDIEKVCNQKDEQGWEFVALGGAADRYVILFRRIKRG
ncbi:hypothetical protein LCGC14_0294530 [marine sediment metagenome]|uniref:DUF4177 domain-containing protein n=1 Tax=marine sediment metagenome TaxID=412755 RepID=A0A0F9TS10_9ZZZZ